ncbi:MAG: YCF48-related protein [Ignavibacteriota bacterium]
MKIKVFILLIITFFLCPSLFSQYWTLQNSGTTKILGESYFSNQNSGWIAGENSLLRTSNGGSNWVSQVVPSLYTYGGIQFLNADTGWVAGSYGDYLTSTGILLKSVNGGTSWATLYNSTRGLWDVVFINSNTGFVCGDMKYFAKTTNGGLNWDQKNLGSTTSEFFQMAFPDNNTGYIVGSHNEIFKTSDAGENWIQQNVSVASWLRDVSFLNVNTGIAVGSNGVILKTTNGGNNWVQKTVSGITSYLFSIQLFETGTVWVAGWDNTLLKSTDFGDTWSVVGGLPGNNQLTNVNFSNPSTGWLLGYNGIILKTTNGGVALNAPQLIYPLNSSTIHTTKPGLTFTSVPEALSYFVQISASSSFVTLTDFAYLTSNQYTVPAGKLTGGNTYYWRVKSIAGTVESQWSSIWNFYVHPDAILNISTEIPEDYTIEQNYPNPFNPSTKIKFGIKEKGNLSISVYDAGGKTLKTENTNSVNPGYYEYNLNMSNYPSGVYYFSYSVNGIRKTVKMLLIK